MTKTYGQQCPIAMALDVIGDRWSLLIVRELALGPLRFTDIAAGLPGVGTRQLTERLRWLTEESVIESVRLPTPTDAPGYALTELGRGLAPALAALAAWGLQRWRTAPRGVSSPTSVALMLWSRAARSGGALRLLAEVTVGQVAFRFAFTDDGVHAWRGRDGDGDAPTVRLHVEQDDALALLSGRLALEQAIRSRRLGMHGQEAAALAQVMFAEPS